MRFSIIIPNYNSEKWIKRLLKTIQEQTYKDYEVIIVDDMSTDGSVEIIESMGYNVIRNTYKRYNGGSRNVGVEHAKGDYIMFADCDDYFYSDKALEYISKVDTDLVRLPYHYLVEKGEGNVMLNEPTLEKLTKTEFVAPWTKCIKRELYVPFPENTLIEDVTQHIEQMEKIETIGYCPVPVIAWNRRNKDSVSINESPKRKNSYFRILADVMDLNVTKPYCIERKQERYQQYLKLTKEKLNEL